MNEGENELFEAELRRLKPARLPDDFGARLSAPPPVRWREYGSRPHLQVWRPGWSFSLRWLAPVSVLAAALLFVVSQLNRGRNSAAPPTAASAPTFKADQVEIDRQLLDSFDAVANMPGCEPVRFRFQQWMDAVTVRDSARGVEVVQRTPRLEVVPVSFDTY